jgi:hypothetical protein
LCVVVVRCELRWAISLTLGVGVAEVRWKERWSGRGQNVWPGREFWLMS